MTDETERFIQIASRSLKSQRAELRWTAAPDDIRAAMGVTLSLLQAIVDQQPDHRVAAAALIVEFSSIAREPM